LFYLYRRFKTAYISEFLTKLVGRLQVFMRKGVTISV